MKRPKRPPEAPPAMHDNCPCSGPNSIGVRISLDNLMHYHLMHACTKFSAWGKKDPLGEVDVEVLIISDPKLLERVRKVLEVPTAETGVTIH